MNESKKQSEDCKKRTEIEMATYKKQFERQMEEMKQAMERVKADSPSPNPAPSTPSLLNNNYQRSPEGFACFGCGNTEHQLRDCPAKTPEEKRHIWNEQGRSNQQRRMRPLNEAKAHTLSG